MSGSVAACYDRNGEPGYTTVDSAAQAALGEITARALFLTGVRPRDTVQLAHTIDASGTAWPVLWALDQLDAVVVATGGLRATPALRQLEFLRRFAVSTLCADDAVVDAIADAARDEGYAIADLPIRRVLLTTHTLPSSRRREIEGSWDASVFGVYGSRVALGWAGIECDASRRANGSLGLHVWDDGLIVEVVDAAGSPCAPGTPGELVETCHVGKSAPVLRRPTGRRGRLLTGACPCGRTTRRVLREESED